MYRALEEFPVINSIAMLILFVGTPLIPFFCGVYMVSKTNHWRGGRIKVFFCNCACMLNKYAPVIAFGNLIWAILICIVQVSYIYHRLNTGNDFTYYLKVDAPYYDVTSVINSAVSFNSLNVFVPQNDEGYIRRLSSSMNIPPNDERFTRRLTSASDTLQLIYHTHDWGNVITEDHLMGICLTERNILQDVTCLDSSSYKSMIPSVFNATSCEFRESFQPFNDSLSFFGTAENAFYVSDTIEYLSPASDVVVSYFKVGNCKEVERTDFETLVDAASVGGIEIAYVSKQYIKNEFMLNEADLQYWTAGSLILCIAFMVLGVRGFILSLTTLICIVVSFINALAILPWWNYKTYSTFNALSIFVLLGVGANSVILYGAAWRRSITPGTHATVAQIIQSYSAVSQSILFTTCVAIVSLFSKLASPVIVISQLGAVMGMSIIVFYICFHYIIIPMWIFTSWFPLPLRWHRWCYKRKIQYCSCICGDGSEPEVVHRTVAEIADDGSDASSVTAASIIPIENVRYDNWQNPHTRSTQNMTPAPAAAAEAAPAEPAEADHSRSHFNMLSFLFTTSSKERGRVNLSAEEDNTPQETVQPAAVVNEPGIISAQPVMVNISSSASRAASHAGDGEEAAAPAPAEPEVAELALDTSICRGKRPLKFFGMLVLLICIGGLVVVYLFVSWRIQFYFGVPQMFESGSNLADVLNIANNYKSNVFNLQSAAVDSYTTFTTSSPSFAPTGATRAPSRSPSYAPTHSFKPTALATSAPSVALTDKKHVDYTVAGCYGIHSHKESVDSSNVISFDQTSFTRYARGSYSADRVITGSGLMNDLNSLCTYVDSNREALSIHPSWVRSRDCIYDQLVTASNASYWEQPGSNSFNMRSLLIYWGYTDWVSGNMMGVQNNGTTHVPMPLWVCANFSLRSYGLSSLNNDGHTAVSVNNAWQKAFKDHGSDNAQNNDVPVIVGSNAFTYSILAQEVIQSIKVAALVCVLGFIGLLWLFTISDFGMTILGSFGIFTIICVSICLHIYFVSPVFDLLDVVVIIAIVGLIVIFPIQLMIEYIFARFDQDERPTQQIDKHLSPALASTNHYIRFVLVPPCILTVLIGIPLLFAKFQLLRKFGEYVIIVALVSFVFTLVFLPYLMALGCRTKWCEAMCYDEEDFHYNDVEDDHTVEEIGGGTNTRVVMVEGDHEEQDIDTAERERELIRIVTQQSMMDAPPTSERHTPPAPMSRYDSYSQRRTPSEAGSVTAEEEMLIRQAARQSMYDMQPPPPPPPAPMMRQSTHQLQMLPSHEDLTRRAMMRQQSQSMRPPLYQQPSSYGLQPPPATAPLPYTPMYPPQSGYAAGPNYNAPSFYSPVPSPPPPPQLDPYGYAQPPPPQPRYADPRYSYQSSAGLPPIQTSYYEPQPRGSMYGRPDMYGAPTSYERNAGGGGRYRSTRSDDGSRYADYDDDQSAYTR